MFVVVRAVSLLKVKFLMNCVSWQVVPLTAGNIISDVDHKDGSLKASKRGVLKTGLKSGLESRLQSGLESALQTVPKSALKILEQIHINPQYTLTELAKQTGYSRSWVAETMKRLQEQGIIKRVGSDKTGHWEIIG